MLDNQNVINSMIPSVRQTCLPGLLVWLLVIVVGCASAFEKHAKVRPWLVKSVHFTGNASISSAELQSRMNTKPTRLFRKVKFSQSLLNEDIDAITSVYRDRGFLQVKVNAGDVDRDPASRRISIDIEVNEGPQTRIDAVTIKGRTVYSETEIKRFILAKPNAPYSTVSLTNDQQTIRDSLAARGYALCAVDRADSLDSTMHRTSVSFVIEQGPLVKAGPLVVNGTKGLRQVIVKRGLTFRQGDTLTTGRIQQSVRQLYESGMFKYVQITTPATDSAAQRRLAGPVSLPVLVNIEEADFYKVQGGVGYGTYEGVRLSLQTSYGNVLGLGSTIGLDAKYSRLLQSLHLQYTVPWFLLLPPTAEAEVFGEHHDDVTFAGYLEGMTLSLYAKTSSKFGYRIYTQFEWVNGVVLQPELSPLESTINHNNTQSFGTGFTYDSRDNLFDPTGGLFVTTDAELAGLIGVGTNHFYKLTMDTRGYFPAADFLSVAGAVTAGYVNGYGVDRAVVPPQEVFFVGSQSIRPVRGYAPGGVGDLLGGRLVVVLNPLELRFAVAKWLKLAAFADAGFVWASPSGFTLNDLRWTAGPGVRIRTPIGMLSMDIGIRLNGPTRGNAGFSVSIGEPF